MCTEHVAVVMRVVHLQLAHTLVAVVFPMRLFRGGDVEIHFLAEEPAERLQYHTGGIGLSVGRIACDVRRTDKYLVEQFQVDVGLVLPDIQYGSSDESLVQGLQDGLGLYYFPP